MSGIVNSRGSKTGEIGIANGVTRSAFCARYSNTTWYTTSGSQKIPFNTTSGGNTCFDVGGDFDTANHRYIAPTNGYYYFNLTMYSFHNSASNYFVYYKNGGIMTQGGGNIFAMANHGTTDMSLHMPIDVQLDKGSYIEVWSNADADWYSGHSIFHGHRVF